MRSIGAPGELGILPFIPIHWASSQPVMPSVLIRPVSNQATGLVPTRRPSAFQTVTDQ